MAIGMETKLIDQEFTYGAECICGQIGYGRWGNLEEFLSLGLGQLSG